MRKISIIFLILAVSLTVNAQKHATNRKNKATTTAKTTKQPQKTTKQTSQKRKSTAAKTPKTAAYANASIKGLQGQRSQIQKKLRQQ